MSIRDGFPDSLTDEEVVEINNRTIFATVGLLKSPATSVSNIDIHIRQSIARLVDQISGEGGSYGITKENRAKVAGLLGISISESNNTLGDKFSL